MMNLQMTAAFIWFYCKNLKKQCNMLHPIYFNKPVYYNIVQIGLKACCKMHKRKK